MLQWPYFSIMSPNGIFINEKKKMIFPATMKLATVADGLAGSEGFHGRLMGFILPMNREERRPAENVKRKHNTFHFLLYILLMNKTVLLIQFNSQGRAIVSPPGDY